MSFFYLIWNNLTHNRVVMRWDWYVICDRKFLSNQQYEIVSRNMKDCGLSMENLLIQLHITSPLTSSHFNILCHDVSSAIFHEILIKKQRTPALFILINYCFIAYYIFHETILPLDVRKAQLTRYFVFFNMQIVFFFQLYKKLSYNFHNSFRKNEN